MSRNCSIVLHAHFPWVRHLEVPHCLEEDWFHSMVVEAYLPLLEMLFRLREEGVPFRLTLDLSPTLLAMLRDAALQRRTVTYLDRTISLCRDEIERGIITRNGDLATQYEARYSRLRSLYVDVWKCDLVRAYSDLRDTGHVELMASAATHGLLPLLMRVPESVQAQVRAGIRQYVQNFGRMPRGFWLPECAFAPVLSPILKREGIDWTIVEEHALTTSALADAAFPFVPGITEAGLHVFGRDQASSREVWDVDDGFAGDDRYRDFSSDMGDEAPMEYLREYLGGSERRQPTGIKYYRSARENDQRLKYDPALAKRAVEEHAMRFVLSRGAQLAALESSGIENPISVCAFDADLFGYWWYEGIDFLEQIFRQMARRQDMGLTTPGAYLATNREQTFPTAAPVSSSWGEGGYFEVWTDEENMWVQTELHERAEQLVRFVKLFMENRTEIPEESVKLHERAIQLMTRELLFVQSSDWPFLLLYDASHEYAENRVRSHLSRFDEILHLTMSGADLAKLEEGEPQGVPFSDLPWNLFESYS